MCVSELYKPEYVPGLHDYGYLQEILTHTRQQQDHPQQQIVCVPRVAHTCEYVPELYKYGCVRELHEYEYVMELHRHIHPGHVKMCRSCTKNEYMLERRRYEYASD